MEVWKEFRHEKWETGDWLTSSVSYGSATTKVLARFLSDCPGVAKTTGVTTAGGQSVMNT